MGFAYHTYTTTHPRRNLILAFSTLSLIHVLFWNYLFMIPW
jgi:hypothetical protein